MDRTSIIAAVSSPPGRSLRGLVRVSGPGAIEVLDAVVASRRAAVAGCENSPSGRRWDRGVHAVRLRVPAPGIAAILLVMPGPGSATGDDSFELLLPGNPHLLERVIDELIAIDPRLRRAGAGEFSARAFLNGRLTLDEAEGVAAIIRATNDAELAAASRLAQGALGERCRAWAAWLAELAALVEAGIDFTDEDDVVAIEPREFLRRISAVERDIDSMIGPGSARRALPWHPRVVLAGAPNAGKSTLFNALIGARRSVADERAGTTRDAIEAPWPLPAGGGTIHAILVDLPGLEAEGESTLSQRLRSAARRALDEADLVLLCRAVDEDGIALERGHELEALVGDRPCLLARTKCDRAPGAEEPLCRSEIRTSALTGAGIGELRRAVVAALSAGTPAGAGSVAVLPRHRAALQRASGLIAEARERAAREPPAGPWRAPEECAAALRLALDSIGQITGATHADEILGLVFSRFCIGK